MKRILLSLAGLVIVLVAVGAVTIYVLTRTSLKDIAIASGEPSNAPGTYEVHLDVDGHSRRYLLHVPPGVSGQQPLPLVVTMHGQGGVADTVEALTGFATKADQERFIIAFPDGIDKRWQDEYPAPDDPPDRVDDVSFLLAMLDDISRRMNIDQDRVYLSGMSNGAHMSSRMACDASGRIAAVALIVGTARPGYEEQCHPDNPVPMILFLGTKDRFVPFMGKPISLFGPVLKSIAAVSGPEMARYWAQKNGCDPTPRTENIPNRRTDDDSTVIRELYTGCNQNAVVDFYRQEGAGHTWPDGDQYLSPLLVGKTNRDINATDLSWDFFEQHTR